MNSSAFKPSQCATLVELLHMRATQPVQEAAYKFLSDGQMVESWSYAELDRRARAIAALLQSFSLKGERALLVYPSGLSYLAAFFGCLYAGVTAVPVYPPRRNRADARLRSVLADAAPAVALTTESFVDDLDAYVAQMPELRQLRWLATDQLDACMAQDWEEDFAGLDTLAFLQYTSGSTSTPKGVMLTHANLLHNSRMINNCLELNAQSEMVMWLPLFHDMGLIGGILQPLYSGASLAFMSPVDFLQHPHQWLSTISNSAKSVVASGAPNFAYELCAQKLSSEQCETLDLSRWKIAWSGAEPIRASTLLKFANRFSKQGFQLDHFLPCYGLAEATLFVSGKPAKALPRFFSLDAGDLKRNIATPTDLPQAHQVVGCGRLTTDQHVVIVDPDTLMPCATGEIGEVWVGGPSIAQGYWHKPEDTHRTFGATLPDLPGITFLRTGDLGFVQEGELVITGRIKELIIIDGRNHYPQDIEETLEGSHSVFRAGSCIAFSYQHECEERLVVVAELDRKYCRRQPNSLVNPLTSDNPNPLDQIVASVCQSITEKHQVRPYDIALVRVGTVPKTSSGKLQRQRCREQYLNQELDKVLSLVESV